MKKLLLISSLCFLFSSCASKPGGWVVGNPMMSEGMSHDAVEHVPQGEEENPCACKKQKKCGCTNPKK